MTKAKKKKLCTLVLIHITVNSSHRYIFVCNQTQKKLKEKTLMKLKKEKKETYLRTKQN